MAAINAFLNSPDALGPAFGIAAILLLIGLQRAVVRQDRPRQSAEPARIVARVRVRADGSVWNLMSDGLCVQVIAERVG